MLVVSVIDITPVTAFSNSLNYTKKEMGPVSW